MKPTVISLYTGAGGLDYGFEAAGFRMAIAVELDPICVKTLRRNRPRWPVIQDDIHDVPTSTILRRGKIKRGDADVLIGGPPCQPFSKSGYWVSGTTERLNDPRASTLEGFLRVLEEALPKSFLIENVEGLGFRGKDEGLQYITRRLNRINENYGTLYKANMQVLNAADFGVPQLRKRLFIVGSRYGKPFAFPKRTHASPDDVDRQSELPYLTAWDALYSLRPRKSDGDLAARGKWAALLPTIPEGQNYLWHTERGGGEPLFGWRRRYWSFLLKLAKDLPSWTIQAQPGPATGPFHWENRRLSVREMARLQTFPKKVTIVGSYADGQRQLGNAVPSLLAEVLAREISCQSLGRRVQGSPKLTIRKARALPAKPGELKPIAAKYVALAGCHEAHPGTGRGYRALSRHRSTKAVA
jgi:DNA (cytosine-5)-methyltransferase 1